MTTDGAVVSRERLARLPLQAITSGLTVALLHVAGLSILLAAAEIFGLAAGETATLIVGVHGLTALLSSAMTLLYRMPLLIGLNATSLFFVLSLAETYAYPEVMGGIIAGGALVVFVAILGLSARLTALVPAPVVFGAVAGAILPFVVGIFSDMDSEPAMIGFTVTAFVLARRFLPVRVPAIVPALAVGILVAFVSDKLQGANDPLAFPELALAAPVFSWQAVIAIGPVVAILVGANANLASIIYLRSQHYDPPERSIHVATGVGTIVGGCLGAIPISMGTVLMPLVASDESGPRSQRAWTVYAASVGMLAIALCAGIAAQVPGMVPTSLLLAVAGLVLIAVLGQMLGGALTGPLRVGPLFAFAVAASDLALWGFGPALWALVIGTSVTLVLEPKELATMRQMNAGDT
jgi:benzoate membrane transport protein